MADDVDVANETANLLVELTVANMAHAPKLPPKGICYYCEDDFRPHSTTPEGVNLDEKGVDLSLKLFCDRDCADDYDKYSKRR